MGSRDLWRMSGDWHGAETMTASTGWGLRGGVNHCVFYRSKLLHYIPNEPPQFQKLIDISYKGQHFWTIHLLTKIPYWISRFHTSWVSCVGHTELLPIDLLVALAGAVKDYWCGDVDIPHGHWECSAQTWTYYCRFRVKGNHEIHGKIYPDCFGRRCWAHTNGAWADIHVWIQIRLNHPWGMARTAANKSSSR